MFGKNQIITYNFFLYPNFVYHLFTQKCRRYRDVGSRGEGGKKIPEESDIISSLDSPIITMFVWLKKYLIRFMDI